MGYRLTERVVVLQLRGTEFEGVEARAKVPSAVRLAAAMQRGDRGIVAELGKHLLSWNVEDKTGEAVDATPDGLAAVDSDLAASLGHEWYMQVSRIQKDRPTRPADDETRNGAAAGTMIESL